MMLTTIDEESAAGRRYGFGWGLAQGIQNFAFGALYLANAELLYRFPDYEYTQGEGMFIALMMIMFGAFTAGQASQFGPDISKAKEAAKRIFSIMEIPSEIDPLAD